MPKNAAITARVKDWGILADGDGWVEVELSGSLQDDKGAVVLNEPVTERFRLSSSKPKHQGKILDRASALNDPRMTPKQ